jgi:hypothetical protein
MKIKITNSSVRTIEIDKDNTITKNSTFKELKEAYAIRYRIEVANIEGVLDAHNFKFELLGKEIPDDNSTLKELFKDEVTISAIIRTPSIAKYLRDINELDPYLPQGVELDEIAAILTKEIARDTAEGTPISANSDKDIVLVAVKKMDMRFSMHHQN